MIMISELLICYFFGYHDYDSWEVKPINLRSKHICYFFQWPIEGNLLGLSWLIFLECTLVSVKQEIQVLFAKDGAFPTLEVSGSPSHHGFQYEKGLMAYPR